MSLLDDKPTHEHIRAFYQHTRTDDAIQLQKKLDTRITDLYFDENKIEADDTAAEGRKRIIVPERGSTGECSRIIDLLGSFYPDPPEAGVQFSGDGPRTQSTGEKVAQALNEGVDQLNTITNTPWVDGVWEMLLLGRRADLIVRTGDYFYDFPEKGPNEEEEAWD